jgi:hypothetical protein
MISPDKLPDEVVTDVAKTIGRFLRKESVEEGLGVGESIQVWTISLAQLRTPGRISFNGRVQWDGVWHHQLRRLDDGAAIAYARSLNLTSGGLEIRSVFRSPLAAEIDSVIKWIDEHLLEEAALVRLLVILDLEWTVVWIASGSENTFIPLGAAFSKNNSVTTTEEDNLEREGERFERVTEEVLGDALSDQEPIVGISRATPAPLVANQRLAEIEGELARLQADVEELKVRLAN